MNKITYRLGGGVRGAGGERRGGGGQFIRWLTQKCHVQGSIVWLVHSERKVSGLRSDCVSSGASERREGEGEGMGVVLCCLWWHPTQSRERGRQFPLNPGEILRLIRVSIRASLAVQ